MRQRLGGRRRCVFPETGEPSGWRDRGKRGEKRPRGFRVGEGRKVAAEQEALPRPPAAPRLPPDARVLLCSGGLRRSGGGRVPPRLSRKEKSARAAKMPLKNRGFEGPMSQWRPPQRFSSAGWML